MSERLTLPIGPQHPLLKEPVHFRFTLDGETIVDADIRLGYNHRGIEKAAEERTYIQDLYMIERICGICSHTHATNFVQAVEKILNVEIPPRAKFLRTVVAELERIHSHLLWLGVAGHEIGFDTLFMVSWRDREIVMDLLEIITGNRVNYGMNTFGGVRKDMTQEEIDQTLKGIKTLEERTNYYAKVATEETTFIARVSGVGYLPHDIALSYCAVGPTARGSGVTYDVRKDLPYAAYDQIPFQVITSDKGDVLGRTIVRVGEIIESVRIIRYALENLPEGPIVTRVPRKVPKGEATSRYEAPRGECIHFVRSNGTEIPDRVKVRAPTMANLMSIRHCLLNQQVADIPIIIAAIDPCLSCTDRLILLEQVGKKEGEILTWEELRRRSIAKKPL
ncbi:MAG: nickel-dependent hydrogenase large subunit [Caldiserica bacterium]|jgi:NADH-quinone oxidoreductase subunit D|nr:nickel-dependent hydrogenase large subunit [Caldisericota bacterium]MDH7562059.1 nickel-dependent hydrogenase large subunit [Caldisericota bacterium]